MRVISFQDSFQDRTLKEDNFNLLVEKHTGRVERPERKPTGLWIWSKIPLQKNLKILFLLERSKLLCSSLTNSLIYAHVKYNSASADLFFCTIWIKFRWSHSIYDSPCHPSIMSFYHYVILALWTAGSKPISHMKCSNHFSIATIR